MNATGTDIANEILIHMFRESVKGKKRITLRELQDHFKGKVSSEYIEFNFDLLVENKLVESYQDNKLTKEGIKLGYNLCEYDLQVKTNDIFFSYEPLGKLGICESSSILDIGCGAGQTIV